MNDVTVYTTPSCPHCVTVKNFLNDRGVAFKEVDLTVEIQEQKTVMEATGMMGVPQTRINDEWVVGFNPDKLAALLDK